MWFLPQPKEGTIMIKDAQVRKLRQFLGEGHPLYRAALKVGMDAKSARKYRHADRLPSDSLAPKEGKRKAKGTLVIFLMVCIAWIICRPRSLSLDSSGMSPCHAPPVLPPEVSATTS